MFRTLVFPTLVFSTLKCKLSSYLDSSMLCLDFSEQTQIFKIVCSKNCNLIFQRFINHISVRVLYFQKSIDLNYNKGILDESPDSSVSSLSGRLSKIGDRIQTVDRFQADRIRTDRIRTDRIRTDRHRTENPDKNDTRTGHRKLCPPMSNSN